VTRQHQLASYVIRDLDSYDELRECVAIQERTWGPDFTELVPAAMLWVATRTGGVVAGAFDQDTRMVGFVFGVTGYRNGHPLHWSDMLAVLPDARGAGLGQALKRHQRQVLLGRGIRDMYWTFDPLEARNAWLNLARLGAVSREYVPDCYGASSSPLHAGLATDRLVAHWKLDAARVRRRLGETDAGPAPAASPPAAPLINPPAAAPAAPPVDPSAAPLVNPPGRLDLEVRAPLVRLRIPEDIQALKQTDLEAARAWRAETRAAFLAYLGRGYGVVEILREESGSSYLLADPEAYAALSS
jgi:predicted GNAT superfamily acetyltransferase